MPINGFGGAVARRQAEIFHSMHVMLAHTPP